MKDKNISIPKDAYSDAAETVVFVVINEKLAGYIALADEIRPESSDAMKIFKKEQYQSIYGDG